MRVLGTTKDSKTYLCEVHHSEIEKFLGLYYGNLKEVKVGDDINLGKGYDHASEIKQAMEKTREFVKAHQGTVNAIINGLRIETLAEAAKEGDGHD